MGASGRWVRTIVSIPEHERSGRNTSAWRGRGRTADLEGRGQQVEFGGAARVGHPGQQGTGGEPADVEAGAVYAGEPDRPQPGQVGVVVADQREPAGHVDVHLRGGRLGADAGQVVDGEDRGRRLRAAEQAHGGAVAAVLGEVGPLDPDVLAEPAGPHGVLVALLVPDTRPETCAILRWPSSIRWRVASVAPSRSSLATASTRGRSMSRQPTVTVGTALAISAMTGEFAWVHDQMKPSASSPRKPRSTESSIRRSSRPPPLSTTCPPSASRT